MWQLTTALANLPYNSKQILDQYFYAASANGEKFTILFASCRPCWAPSINLWYHSVLNYWQDYRCNGDIASTIIASQRRAQMIDRIHDGLGPLMLYNIFHSLLMAEFLDQQHACPGYSFRAARNEALMPSPREPCL